MSTKRSSSNFRYESNAITQNEVSRMNQVDVIVTHMSEEEKERVLRKLYDLSGEYEYDIDICVSVVSRQIGFFRICTKHLSLKKKIAFHNELKVMSDEIKVVRL